MYVTVRERYYINSFIDGTQRGGRSTGDKTVGAVSSAAIGVFHIHWEELLIFVESTCICDSRRRDTEYLPRGRRRPLICYVATPDDPHLMETIDNRTRIEYGRGSHVTYTRTLNEVGDELSVCYCKEMID